MSEPDRSLPSQPPVVSITVAFNAEAERLAQQVAALEGQVAEIVVVDNASATRVEKVLAGRAGRTPLHVVTLAENQGVARAFNLGIARARRVGAAFVLLLDHDSVPGPGMVPALLAAHAQCAREGPPVAALGPRVIDERDRRDYPFIRMGWTHNRHLRCGPDGGMVSCDFLISSGSLVPIAALDALGDFDESLFIDSVDLEWCCRARSEGHALYGVCGARLDHRLGDCRRRVAGGLALVVHSPERIYYMTRNRLLLYQRGYMPLKWKLKDLLRWSAKFASLMLFVAPRAQYARMTLRAMADAFSRRGGKLAGAAQAPAERAP